MNSQKIPQIILTLVFITTSHFVNLPQVVAADNPVPPAADSAVVFSAQASAGAVSSNDNNFKLSFGTGSFASSTEVSVIRVEEPASLPWQINKLSKVYQFEISNKAAYNKTKPLAISLKYEKQSDKFKQLFFYDKNYDSWRPLPSKDSVKTKSIQASVFLPFARVAVFEFSQIPTTGKASWYAHKNGLFSASPDFPIGSKLRVYNAANEKKFVDVIVNDYGPDRTRHPDRVVDLEKTAFKKLASLGEGTIKIRVEPLSIPAVAGKYLGLPATGAAAELKLSSKAAVILNARTGKVIWTKQATSSLPIASLTKMVAAKVFLDTKSDLKATVAYSLADEGFNYRYAKKGEISRLNAEDGETLTAEDLLYSSLVGSANNTVESLVRASGLGRDDFINRMNAMAKNFGATSTIFVEPTGLSPQNVSSAMDYAIISRKVLENPLIAKITKTKSYKFTAINNKKVHTIKNTNKLVIDNRVKVTVSKTGYLDEAGYCLMTGAKNAKNDEVIVVTLGAPSRVNSFVETEELINFGLSKIQ